MTKVEAQALTAAIEDMISVTPSVIIVRSAEAAKEISQLYLDATDNNKGAIYGPYSVNGNDKIKRWHIEI